MSVFLCIRLYHKTPQPISIFHQAYLHHLFDASCAQRKPSSAAIEQKKKEVKGVVHQIISPISNSESKIFLPNILPSPSAIFLLVVAH